MKIITNNHWRNILYGYELTEKEREEFDYLDDIDAGNFIQYRGSVYDLGEFFITPESLKPWEAHQSDSYFSGTVIMYSKDLEQVKVGTYIS